MKGDLKMIKAKLSELMAMCGEDDDGGESSAKPQDGQPSEGSAINDGGQETLETAGEEKETFFMNAGDPEGNKKKKLDVIAAAMKRKFNK